MSEPIARELSDRLTAFVEWADGKPPAAKTGVNLNEAEARFVLSILQPTPEPASNV